MKKIMDNKKTLVQDMLEGYVKAFPRRVRLLGNHILLRAKEKDLSKTAVIIGNGSGHEPAMIDLVGEGLFDANVCGKIFAAPSPMEMMDALKELSKNGHKEILILVSSHAGDILNAKMTLMFPVHQKVWNKNEEVQQDYFLHIKLSVQQQKME